MSAWMKPADVIAKARTALGQGIRYELGRGGFRPEAGTPAPAGECDCSGFIAWCLGLPRKSNDPFYLKENGGWFETSAICADIRSPFGYFQALAVPRTGCVAVYADRDGQQGHIGLVSRVKNGNVETVIHCSWSAWKTSGGAIVENRAPVLANNPAVLFGWFAGYAWQRSKLISPALLGERYLVAVDRLNLRSVPGDLSPATVIGILRKNQIVAKVADTSESLWWKIHTVIDDKLVTGFVNAGLLVKARTGAPDTEIPRAVVVDEGAALVNEKALQMILDFEGIDQPAKWPGEQSGISLGHGYDLGYHTYDDFMGDWGPHLTDNQLARLAKAIGRRGSAAHRLAPDYADIAITKSVAGRVFIRCTLPKIKLWAAKTFPGIAGLPSDAQGALVSLVYNRGTDMRGDRRREMREIRDAVADAELILRAKLDAIATSLRSMKRLWPNTRGLRRRRDAEAKLVAEATFPRSVAGDFPKAKIVTG